MGSVPARRAGPPCRARVAVPPARPRRRAAAGARRPAGCTATVHGGHGRRRHRRHRHRPPHPSGRTRPVAPGRSPPASTSPRSTPWTPPAGSAPRWLAGLPAPHRQGHGLRRRARRRVPRRPRRRRAVPGERQHRQEPSTAPHLGGFTGWTLLGVDPVTPAEAAAARANPLTAGPRWLAAEVTPHVDAVHLVAPATVRVGTPATVTATLTQPRRPRGPGGGAGQLAVDGSAIRPHRTSDGPAALARRLVRPGRRPPDRPPRRRCGHAGRRGQRCQGHRHHHPPAAGVRAATGPGDPGGG